MNTETWIRVWARGTPVVCPGVCPENIGIECCRKGTVLINLPPDGDAVCAFHADGSITDTHPGHALAAGIGAARAEAHAHTHMRARAFAEFDRLMPKLREIGAMIEMLTAATADTGASVPTTTLEEVD